MGKRVEVSTVVGSYWRGFGGEQSPTDLETALQLICRLFSTRVQPVPAELATCLRCWGGSCPLRAEDCAHVMVAVTNVTHLSRCTVYFFADTTLTPSTE